MKKTVFLTRRTGPWWSQFVTSLMPDGVEVLHDKNLIEPGSVVLVEAPRYYPQANIIVPLNETPYSVTHLLEATDAKFLLGFGDDFCDTLQNIATEPSIRLADPMVDPGPIDANSNFRVVIFYPARIGSDLAVLDKFIGFITSEFDIDIASVEVVYDDVNTYTGPSGLKVTRAIEDPGWMQRALTSRLFISMSDGAEFETKWIKSASMYRRGILAAEHFFGSGHEWDDGLRQKEILNLMKSVTSYTALRKAMAMSNLLPYRHFGRGPVVDLICSSCSGPEAYPMACLTPQQLFYMVNDSKTFDNVAYQSFRVLATRSHQRAKEAIERSIKESLL